ncbi:MAG TPA: XRE family transcriptional regulator, partial [Vicinamibacteria bacterium]|nr:XRE family transcriptional regulator [Vicinamibacteria bacterium]
VGADVTESYISQLLTRKKAPPAPERTDIYSKMEKLLRLPKGRLSKLAELQRKEELKRKVLDPPAPLFKEVRKLILRKCASHKREQVRAIFERQPIGEIERLITQKLLDVVKTLAREELDNERWLRIFARASNRSYEEVRVDILEFLDTDVFHVSDEDCVSFIDPLIESWDIDFATFGIVISLNRRLGPASPKRFGFVEQDLEPTCGMEPGLEEFLSNSSLRGDVTQEEIEFLKRLRFKGMRPTPLYFYREVQSLRDPLHFRKAQAAIHSRPNSRPDSRPNSRTESRRQKHGA